MKKSAKKFIVNAVRWYDGTNTYHSVKIVRVRDGKTIVSNPMVYGYSGHYRQTAIDLMSLNKWLPVKHRSEEGKNSYDRENNYPIIYNVYDGLKRDMVNNVKFI